MNRIATNVVERVKIGDSVTDAAQTMRWSDIGFLPVMNSEGFAVGVLTDRDIVTKVVSEGLDPRVTPVEQIMTTPVHWIYKDAEMRDACRVMAVHGVRRLIVCDRNHKPTGIISLDDLAMFTNGDNTVGRILSQIAETEGLPIIDDLE
ncbi:MAG TPA: CBS domain-containing protein [Fimbriimonas sp.]|nr:CBS domain-containing protein [Fimbriimonas sp.]